MHMKTPSRDLPMTTPIVVMSDKERLSPNAVVFFAHSASRAGSKHFTAPIVLAAFLKENATIERFNQSQKHLQNNMRLVDFLYQ